MDGKENLTPLKAIRAKCLDCCAGSANEVKLCSTETCSLYRYRMGKNPNRQGIGNHQASIQSVLPNPANNLQ